MYEGGEVEVVVTMGCIKRGNGSIERSVDRKMKECVNCIFDLLLQPHGAFF